MPARRDGKCLLQVWIAEEDYALLEEESALRKIKIAALVRGYVADGLTGKSNRLFRQQMEMMVREAVRSENERWITDLKNDNANWVRRLSRLQVRTFRFAYLNYKLMCAMGRSIPSIGNDALHMAAQRWLKEANGEYLKDMETSIHADDFFQFDWDE